MTSFHIVFKRWMQVGEWDVWDIPVFSVYHGHEKQRLFDVGSRFPYVAAYQVLDKMGSNGERKNEELSQAFLRHVMRRIEQGLRDGIFPTAPTSDVQWIDVIETDIPFLERLLQEKTYLYQHQEGRDLLGSAADPNDPDKVGQIGFRTVAPTSRAVCRLCTLPHTDYLCSHLMHPFVRSTQSHDAPLARLLVKAACDLGRDEIRTNPSQCLAGGHPC